MNQPMNVGGPSHPRRQAHISQAQLDDDRCPGDGRQGEPASRHWERLRDKRHEAGWLQELQAGAADEGRGAPHAPPQEKASSLSGWQRLRKVTQNTEWRKEFLDAQVESLVDTPVAAACCEGSPRWRSWTLDEFRRTDVLDFGSFGQVPGAASAGQLLKIVHKRTTEPFAVMVMQLATIEEHDLHTKLGGEVGMQFQHRHPNILRLHNYYEDGMNLYFVMEYPPDGTLAQMLRKRGGKLPEYEAAHVLTDIMKAIDHLHYRDVVHRNLQKDNVLICGHTAKISNHHIVSPKKIMLTGRGLDDVMDYLAPEIVRAEPYDHWVDVWAAGVLMYEMLSGRLPFSTGNRMRLSMRIMVVDLHIPLPITPLAGDLIRRLIVKDKKDRLSPAQAVKHDWVQRYVAGAAIIRPTAATNADTPEKAAPSDTRDTGSSMCVCGTLFTDDYELFCASCGLRKPPTRRPRQDAGGPEEEDIDSTQSESYRKLRAWVRKKTQGEGGAAASTALGSGGLSDKAPLSGDLAASEGLPVSSDGIVDLGSPREKEGGADGGMPLLSDYELEKLTSGSIYSAVRNWVNAKRQSRGGATDASDRLGDDLTTEESRGTDKEPQADNSATDAGTNVGRLDSYSSDTTRTTTSMKSDGRDADGAANDGGSSNNNNGEEAAAANDGEEAAAAISAAGPSRKAALSRLRDAVAMVQEKRVQIEDVPSDMEMTPRYEGVRYLDHRSNAAKFAAASPVPHRLQQGPQSAWPQARDAFSPPKRGGRP